MENNTLKNRIQANYRIFDKALNPSTRADGMAQISVLFPELIETSFDQNRFEFRSLKHPDIYITIMKQVEGWKMTMVCIPGE